jgi:hypothetical protein
VDTPAYIAKFCNVPFHFVAVLVITNVIYGSCKTNLANLLSTAFGRVAKVGSYF